MGFKPNALYFTDGYKVGHKAMLAPGTTRLYGTGIPRSTKYCPKGITKIVSMGQQLTVRWLHDLFEDNFFKQSIDKALFFSKDMALYLGMEYDGLHFIELHKLGYLPFQYQALPEGIETLPNIPHSTFINTVDGFGWLTLYLETIISSLSWKPQVAATIALQYKRQATEWVMKTDPSQAFLIPYMCHDFSARGTNPHDQISIGLAHAACFRGSDTLVVIPAARYYYDEPENEVCINSVNASKHSVSCTNIFYYKDKLEKGELNDKIKEYYEFDLPCDGSIDKPDYLAIAEWLMLRSWLVKFPKGILSYVCDTFNTWKSATHIAPRLKKEIMTREGKLVLRPDSGNPVDIICGRNSDFVTPHIKCSEEEFKGVVELLWDTFEGTVNDQGYKVLDSHIGAIYGDSITPDRQVQIYERLAAKGFAATNIVLGVGSYTYQYNTRDTTGYAIKGAWFEIEENFLATPESVEWGVMTKRYNIYKDPITDDGTKKSLKGFQFVYLEDGEYKVEGEVSEEKAYSEENILKTIYKDGKFYNQTTLANVRTKIDSLVQTNIEVGV